MQAATRFALIALLAPSFVLAQDRQVSNAMRRFVSVDAQVVVTAHLCSVTYREAVALGIDNLEHGLTANTDYMDGKQLDQCPSVSTRAVYGDLDIYGPDVQQTIREMVENGVSMTSTLAVMELSTPSRVPVDQRVLDAAKLIESTKGQVGLQ